MKDYSGIIQDIKDNITENGKGEITGRDLREILLEAIGNVSVDMEELDRRIEAILGGENYDDIINSWAELEQFLSGLDESSNLAELLSYKADKSDVYSRSDINAKLEDYTKTDDLGALAFKDEVEMSDIKNLEDALDKKLDKEGGEIENNLLVKGELNMGVLFVPTSDGEPSSYRLAIGELGEGADIPSSGEGGLGSVTIMLGDVPYYSDSNGIVRLPAYPTGGGGGGEYLPITGGTIDTKNTTNGVPLIINTNYENETAVQVANNGSVKSVFGWWRGITGYDYGTYMYNVPNYTYLGIGNDGIPYYGNGIIGRKELIHSGNYSDYALPLSGGTMQGNLDLGKNSITNAKELSCYDSGTGYYVGGRNYGLGVTDGGLLLYSYGDTPISFYTYGTEKMRITSGGNVLIGTTTDNGSKLQVNSGNYGGVLQLTSTTTYAGIGLTQGNGYMWFIGSDNTEEFYLWYGGEHRFDLNKTGNLKLGGSLFLNAGDYIANRATLILNSNGQPADIIFKSNSTSKGNYGWWAISSRNDGTGRFSIFRGTENGVNNSEAEIFTIRANGQTEVNGNFYASGYQLPTSAPSNPVSGGYYLYVGSLGSGAVIS